MNNPVRTCIVCRKEFQKNELIRVVRMPDGSIAVDKSGKQNGRGAYICGSPECVKKLKKSKLLNRTFKQEISEEIYSKVEDAVFGKKE